ncbi:MAG: histidine ammonia-lyase [Vicinamibacteria bacterium]|nr:histidine ammonia-lyase [Vicinamibacteria bacterium]
MGRITLNGNDLAIVDLAAVASGASVGFTEAAVAAMRASRAVVDGAVARGDVVYGVNTGFGNFADVRIGPMDLEALQRNLVRSHAAGVGPTLPILETRALMVLRANVLAKGFSGARVETASLLIECLNRGIHPKVPEQGSVGASGDLAPLAHVALLLIGEGECEVNGQDLKAAEALAAAGLKPVTLGAKEGLALINGTQLMTGIAALALLEAETLARTADVVAAMTVDALLGTDVAFDPRIHAARPHAGQAASARNLKRLLEGSALRESHRNCGRVQDAYSLRCAPQVHGACRDALAFVRRTLEIEMNSATDNPMVFAESGELLSGGNFHGEPAAMAADFLSIAAAEIGGISERRIERLVNPSLSGLPAFLTEDGGLRSGFMMAHVTAAALASENKSLAHPASVDSITTSANKEDHVSMGPIAARQARSVVANVRRILAIEALAAAQAIEFHRPLRTSNTLEAVHAALRAAVPKYDTDRIMGPEIEHAAELIRKGDLVRAAEHTFGAME